MFSPRALLALAVVGIAVASVFCADEEGSSPKQSRSIVGGIAAAIHKWHTTPTDYQERSAEAKQDFIWKQIQKTAYPTDQLPTRQNTDKRNLTDVNFLLKTFTHVSDEVPEGRQKLSHQYGVVGKVQFEIFSNSPYTGIFKAPGAPIALARLSVAKLDDPVFVSANIALKVLIDGKPSVNFNSFQSSEGPYATDRNFFAQKLTNTVPEPLAPQLVGLNHFFNKTLTLIAAEGPTRPQSSTKLGLYEQASTYQNGKTVDNVVAPWKIEWVPNAVLRDAMMNQTAPDFRTNLMTIPEGTVLYDIVLYRHNPANGYPGAFVGRLVLRSPLIASQYGDEVLFFQHANKRWQA